jgi:membrane glycosyltransferase
MMSGTSTLALLLAPMKVTLGVPVALLMSTLRLVPGRAIATLALGVSMLLLMAPAGMTWYARMVVSVVCGAKRAQGSREAAHGVRITADDVLAVSKHQRNAYMAACWDGVVCQDGGQRGLR